MQQTIKYKGITRIPSDHDSFNGEMEEMYNLINTNGELKPVVDPDTIGTLSGRFIFVHKNAGYEHFITIDGIYIKAYNYASETITSIGNITSIYGETLRKIESVGNTLIVITDKEIKYVLWKDNQYKYLGNQIPFPAIKFRPVSAVRVYNEKDVSQYQPYLKVLNGYYTSQPLDNNMVNDCKTEIAAYFNANINELHSGGHITYPIFIRYAVRLYDGSLINHSMPILIMTSLIYNALIAAYSDYKKIRMSVLASGIEMSYTAQDLSQWEDIIQSIDIFMSEPIYTSGDEIMKWEGEVDFSLSRPLQQYSPDAYYSMGKLLTKEELINKIINVGNFYFVQSLSLSDINQAKTEYLNTTEIGTLVNKERMTDDYLSHDKITAENSYVYNNKLHLSGIHRTMFSGFRLTNDDCYYFGAQEKASTYINQSIVSFMFLFYPGKCNKLLLSRHTESGYIENILDLKKHPRLNGYYYIDPNLNPIGNSGSPTSQSILEATINSNKTVIEESDKLYVSAHQNPFYFPVEQRITLPVGRIIAMSSNTEAISQGQFGQFPLYVFTDDGIWALEMNSEGKYMIRQPVSREVCVNPNILQMDNAVAFISKKGITILSGAETECISNIIKDNNTRSSKLDINSFIVATQSDELQQVYQTDDIGVFLEGCNMAYEYLNGIGRLYAINSNYKYAYVFDILSRTWSKVKADYISQVNNYPDCYVQSPDGTIKNLSTIGSDTSPIKTFFITRAIKYEDVLFSLTHIAHRGIFKSVLNTVIYASRDGINYTPIYSDKKNIMKISGSPFRYYKIAVIASLDPKDTVSGVDISFEPRYMNRLR